MNETITKIQTEAVNKAKIAIVREYHDGRNMIDTLSQRVAEAIAHGKTLVNTSGIHGVTCSLMRYYQVCQFLRNVEENCSDIAGMYEAAFEEKMPEEDPTPGPEKAE